MALWSYKLSKVCFWSQNDVCSLGKPNGHLLVRQKWSLSCQTQYCAATWLCCVASFSQKRRHLGEFNRFAPQPLKLRRNFYTTRVTGLILRRNILICAATHHLRRNYLPLRRNLLQLWFTDQMLRRKYITCAATFVCSTYILIHLSNALNNI